MIICRRYVHEFSVSKVMKTKFNNEKRRKEVTTRKVAAHSCLTLITKELKISVELDRVITTLNIIFSVVWDQLTDFEMGLNLCPERSSRLGFRV